MPSQFRSPPIARCLLVAIFFALGFLAIVSLSDSYTSRSLQRQDPPPKDDQSESPLEKRLEVLGGVVSLVPSLLGSVVPGGIISSLVAQVTADINTLLPILNDPGAQSPDGLPLVNGGQAALPLTAQPLPTGAQLGNLADKLGDLLNGIAPVAAPGIIAEITKQAFSVVASVEAIATDVASLGNQVANKQIQAPDALSQIGGLLGSLDSKVNDIINGVTSDLSSELPLPVLQDLNQAISSGLGDIVGAANGPLSLVGDLIEQNVCGAVTLVDGVLATVAGLCGDIPSAIAQVSSEIATASLTNPDVTLTGDASASTIFPNSPTVPGGLTANPPSPSSPQIPPGQGISTNPITSNSGGGPSSGASSVSGIQTSPGQSPTDISVQGLTIGISPPKFPSFTLQPLLTPSSVPLTVTMPASGVPSTPISAGASVPGTTGKQSPSVAIPSPSMAGSPQTGQSGASITTATSANGVVTVTQYQTMTQSCTTSVIQPTIVQLPKQSLYPGLPQVVSQRPKQPVIVPMLALHLPEGTVPRVPARELVIRVTIALMAGSALPLRRRHSPPLVVLDGHVRIATVAGFVLLPKLPDHNFVLFTNGKKSFGEPTEPTTS
ncbi:hypothetical protein F4803DRAFT_575932 [Xylaria telfairii]|nr:hypothetical protein F4803DRAFT_575932 [Xylaria telfairii]